MRRKRWLRSIGEIALVVALFFGISAWQGRRLLDTSGPAPELRLSSLDGHEYSLAELRGKAVLLHFWATWCGVCKMELSGLNSLYDHLPNDTVLLSVVADADDRPKIDSFVREHGLRYPVLLADEATIERFRVTSFPTNYYVDDAGNLEQATVGMSTRVSMWLRLWLASW